MKRSFMANLADKVVCRTHKFTIEKVSKCLSDFKTNKDNYKIPFFLKFPRKMKTNMYNDMQVFEMEPKSNSKKCIMYIHGGGYITNFSIFHWRFLINLSKKTGYGITAPNYPLLPKYTYKQSHEKVIKYYKQFSKKHDMKNVVIMGDSAGGGYVLALLQEIKKAKLPLPGKAILISPFVDAINVDKTLNDMDSVVQAEGAVLAGIAWAGGDKLSLPQISPTNGDLKGLPPIDIYIGTYEVLYKQCVEVAKKLKKAGNKGTIHIGEKMSHIYPILPIPEGEKAIEEIIDFIEKE